MLQQVAMVIAHSPQPMSKTQLGSRIGRVKGVAQVISKYELNRSLDYTGDYN